MFDCKYGSNSFYAKSCYNQIWLYNNNYSVEGFKHIRKTSIFLIYFFIVLTRVLIIFFLVTILKEIKF